MPNPLFNQNGSSNAQQGGILGMIDQIRRSSDPNAAMQSMVQTNPQLKGVMDYIQQNGGDMT